MGDDSLYGGSQGDTCIFRDAAIEHNIINDFEAELDTIILDTSLTGGSSDFTQAITRFGQIIDGAVVRTFNTDSSITFANMSTLSALSDDILM